MIPTKNTIKLMGSHVDFSKHKQYVYSFQNVQCKTKNNITSFFYNNKIIEETLDEHIFWRPRYICREKCYDPVSKSFYKKEVERRKLLIQNNFDNFCCEQELFEDKAVDVTHSFGHYAFGHLFDSLQRLFHVKNEIKEKIKFIVSDYRSIKDFLIHLSVLCERNITEADIICTSEDQLINVSNLCYSLSPTIPTEIDKDAYIWILNQYYNYFKINKPKPVYNLYLSRNHIKNNSRSVLNNEEVTEYLSKFEFIVLYGNEPLNEIVNYFANAKTIIGAHGAMFANCIFCNNEAKIVEFCATNRRWEGFKRQLKMAQNYNQIFVQADELYNINIPLEDITNYV